MTQERMTAAQFRQQFSADTKKTKYGNKNTVVDGITFDSKREADYYCELKQLRQAGEIQGFERQPSFIIDPAGGRYRPDFIVCDKDGKIYVIDVKGHETEKFRRDRRLWEVAYPWLPLIVVR